MIEKKNWDAFQKDLLNKTEVGKLILCESKEEASTRLFIHQFNTGLSCLTKDGWWDTFTVTMQPCNPGFYLCKILNFRIDKNGYLNVVVSPDKYLGENIDEDSAAWDFFFGTELFCREYSQRSYHLRFNTDFLRSQFSEELNAIEESEKEKYGEGYLPSTRVFDKLIFKKFLNDEISIEFIEKALNEKSDLEKLSEDIYRNENLYKEKYPLLIKKLPVDDSLNFVTPDSIKIFIQRKNWEYDSLKLGNEADLLKRVENVLQYWIDFHKAEKAKKKANKKEKNS